jgi:poly-gamma-glutamate synthesis protein (capsule biosynthesis protein)
VLLAGGDIDLSRRTGQRILADATLDPFAQIRPLLQKADLRFANLESQLCELSGKTRSEHNSLVFAGPPAGALVLRRGLLDIVSTANNHAWDFGKRCAQETILHLRNAGIAHVGTSADGNAPMRARIVQRNGQRFAFLAVTGIFNDGRLRDHVAREYVADADMGAMRKRSEEVRSQVDWVIASVHVGEEYMHVPVQATRYALFGAVDAGADLVLGHHTHTPQRVEYYQGKPVVMSLGNYVFHQHSDHPWTGWGYLARVRFEPATRPLVAICPYHLFNAAPQPLTEQQRAVFLVHWDAISRLPSSAVRGEPDADGCVPLAPPG